MEARDTVIMEKNKALQEKTEALQEKTDMLRSMILDMQKNGMTLTDIAKMLGKTVDEVERFI